MNIIEIVLALVVLFLGYELFRSKSDHKSFVQQLKDDKVSVTAELKDLRDHIVAHTGTQIGNPPPADTPPPPDKPAA